MRWMAVVAALVLAGCGGASGYIEDEARAAPERYKADSGADGGLRTETLRVAMLGSLHGPEGDVPLDATVNVTTEHLAGASLLLTIESRMPGTPPGGLRMRVLCTPERIETELAVGSDRPHPMVAPNPTGSCYDAMDPAAPARPFTGFAGLRRLGDLELAFQGVSGDEARYNATVEASASGVRIEVEARAELDGEGRFERVRLEGDGELAGPGGAAGGGSFRFQADAELAYGPRPEGPSTLMAP